MADDRPPAAKTHAAVPAGHILMWLVGAATPEEAEALALDMGATAQALEWGEWCASPLGGKQPLCWFDITLAVDLDPVLLVTAFGSLPDRRY